MYGTLGFCKLFVWLVGFGLFCLFGEGVLRVPEHTSEGQRATCGYRCCPSATWALRELRLSGRAAGPYLSLVLNSSFLGFS